MMVINFIRYVFFTCKEKEKIWFKTYKYNLIFSFDIVQCTDIIEQLAPSYEKQQFCTYSYVLRTEERKASKSITIESEQNYDW